MQGFKKGLILSTLALINTVQQTNYTMKLGNNISKLD